LPVSNCKIKDAGVINVGLEGTYPPFSFVDADGKLTGFEVELSEALAKELGVKVNCNRPNGTASSRRWNPSVWTP
jgi:ABC-type amino acid transport substrate-binding protein